MIYNVILIVLAAMIALQYFIIGLYVIPKIYRTARRSDNTRILTVAAGGAALFFVGCAFTHIEVLLHADLLDNTHTLHHILNHIPQVIGGWTFIYIAWKFLDIKFLDKEKVALREELEVARRKEAVADLATGVAHDFKHIIGIIKNYLNFVIKDMSEDSVKNIQLQEDLLEIRQAVEQGERLARQLSLFGRMSTSAPIEIDLNAVVRNVLPVLRFEQAIEVRTELDPTIPPVCADLYQIEQVLVNLAVNARDAMPDGGTLTIETGSERRQDDRAEQGVRLTIRDTGCGMSERVKERALEPYFTTKDTNGGEGTGLGLSSVASIVQSVGGRIGIESESGQGTAITIWFPWKEDSECVTSASAASADGAPSS